MLTNHEVDAIAKWAGWAYKNGYGWICPMPTSRFQSLRTDMPRSLPSFEEDPRAHMPLFDRLAGREWGMGLWRYDEDDGQPWVCCVPDEDGAENEDLPGGRGATRGEAICRAVLAVIEASTLDKKAKL